MENILTYLQMLIKEYECIQIVGVMVSKDFKLTYINTENHYPIISNDESYLIDERYSYSKKNTELTAKVRLSFPVQHVGMPLSAILAKLSYMSDGIHFPNIDNYSCTDKLLYCPEKKVLYIKYGNRQIERPVSKRSFVDFDIKI